MKSFMNFFFDVFFLMFSMEGWKYLAFIKIFAKLRFIINFNFGEYEGPFHNKNPNLHKNSATIFPNNKKGKRNTSTKRFIILAVFPGIFLFLEKSVNFEPHTGKDSKILVQ